MAVHELTVADIVSSDDPYITVTDYAVEIYLEHGRDAVLMFSPELYSALAVVELDSDCHNGGLEQYFGNRTSNDGVVFPEIGVACGALEKYGALKVANLLTRALSVWQELIEERKAILATGDMERHRWFEKVDQKMSGFNDEWYEYYDESVNVISTYMLSHASEFCGDGHWGREPE